MNTDDCLSEFIGSKFVNAEIKDGPSGTVDKDEDSYDAELDAWLTNNTEEESQFLVITTTKGQFTVVNYVEHNGFYGGFDIELEEIK